MQTCRHADWVRLNIMLKVVLYIVLVCTTTATAVDSTVNGGNNNNMDSSHSFDTLRSAENRKLLFNLRVVANFISPPHLHCNGEVDWVGEVDTKNNNLLACNRNVLVEKTR